MRLLILGGTRFLGRHLVDAALARGHELTLFNRGQSNPDIYPEVERIQGDRDGGLDGLRGRSWDAVIDTSGYFPRVVRQSAELLAGSVGRYTFISSLSVYADSSTVGMDESAPVATLEDESVEEITGETYGALKYLCEQAVAEVYGARALNLRPGLIVGPFDPTDRFTYWPHRVAAGGEVLAPGEPGQPVQVIDARDLAEWNIRLVEQGTGGVYNAVGPNYPLTMGAFLEGCGEASGSGAALTWVPQAFLLEREVEPWSDLPVWVPDTEEFRGFHRFNIDRALAAGLTFRPLAETIRDTLEWDSTRPPDHEWRAGISREREAELLAQWHARGDPHIHLTTA